MARLVGSVACLMLLLAAGSPPARGESAGRMLFLAHCASCHGYDGRGEGPVSAALRTPPADLTQLTRRYGVPLDRERLATFIDGREEVQAHGPRQMPVWGRVFGEAGPKDAPDGEASTRRLIDLIIDHLVTLQSARSAAR